MGASVEGLHGDLEQFDRDQVLAKFRNHSTRILVATDVAGRGIDVDTLELVVNYELPQSTEVYIHRIGRTGRAGEVGLAVSLASKREVAKLERIEQHTGQPVEQLSMRQTAGADSQRKSFFKPAKMDTLLISGGRKDKIRPGDILGALTGEAAGLNAADIGKIEIHDRFCYVAIAKKVGPKAVRGLNNGKIKGKKFRASFAKKSQSTARRWS